MLTVLGSCKHAGDVGDETYAGATVVLGAERSVLVAAAGGDQNNARIGTGTVDSSRRTVLEDVDGFDIRGLYRREVATRNAVDDVQGLGGTVERTYASELHVVAVLCRVVAAVLDNVKTGNLTLEQTHGVGHAALVEVVRFER